MQRARQRGFTISSFVFLLTICALLLLLVVCICTVCKTWMLGFTLKRNCNATIFMVFLHEIKKKKNGEEKIVWYNFFCFFYFGFRREECECAKNKETSILYILCDSFLVLSLICCAFYLMFNGAIICFF